MYNFVNFSIVPGARNAHVSIIEKIETIGRIKHSKECIDKELLLDTFIAPSFSPCVSQTLTRAIKGMPTTFSISRENQIAKLYFFLTVYYYLFQFEFFYFCFYV